MPPKVAQIGMFRHAHIDFPLSNKERTKLWIRGVRAVDCWPTSGMHICRKHFVNGKPSEYPSGVDYVPTTVNNKKGGWRTQRQLVQEHKEIRKGAGRRISPRYWLYLLKYHQLVLLELQKRNRPWLAQHLVTCVLLPYFKIGEHSDSLYITVDLRLLGTPTGDCKIFATFILKPYGDPYKE